jgi:hypothetical protein
MPQPNPLTTQEIINSVYGWLGEPNKAVLKPTIVCVKLWTVLGKRQLELQITDRTIYLVQQPLAVAENQMEVAIGDVQFSDVLSLQMVRIESGVEQTMDIPVIGDGRDAGFVGELAAYVYIDPANNLKTLRFNQPFPEAATLRAWMQPLLSNRPGREEKPQIPNETAQLLILDTAEACLPEVAKLYDPMQFSAYAKTIAGQKLETKIIYDRWRMNNSAQGKRKRTPYRQGRRVRGGAYFDYGEQ